MHRKQIAKQQDKNGQHCRCCVPVLGSLRPLQTGKTQRMAVVRFEFNIPTRVEIDVGSPENIEQRDS